MEKTILVGVITNNQGVEKSMDYLDELAFLTKTAGGSVYKVFTHKLNNPNPKTVIGEGKILIQDNGDDIFYKIDRVNNKDIKFETSIQINDNPINIDFLSYEKKNEEALINFKGIKKDKENLLIS